MHGFFVGISLDGIGFSRYNNRKDFEKGGCLMTVKKKRIISAIASAVVLLAALVYVFINSVPNELTHLAITNGERLTMEVGSTVDLDTNADGIEGARIKWMAAGNTVSVDEKGFVTALETGKVKITVTLGNFSDSIIIDVIENDPDRLDDTERDAFYADYEPAESHEEALERSRLGLLSGMLTVPDQEPTVSSYQPKKNGLFIRNEETRYADENTYIVVDAYGEEVFTIYRGGAYITLEEVAAYVYAFGDVPANYISGKNMEPENSLFGEYLRLNHTAFSGNTEKYPYEPVLPDISGCGGELFYYEIDIGTTGTDSDPRYSSRIYNDGETITRGAARIVYTRYDKNRNEIIEPNEKYVFYTYNHYNDFQEYLNYYGGWGEMFGNITGGGIISDDENCNPTPYVPTTWGTLTRQAAEIVWYFDFKKIKYA